MVTIACPETEKLRAFQAGRLNLDELDQIVGHLDTCITCQTVIQQGDTGSDELIRRLKMTPEFDSFLEESDCQRAVAEVAAIAGKAVTQTREDTADPYASGGDSLPEQPEITSLGQYELLEPIGRGAMGVVYKAAHTHLKKTVAVKVLPAERLKNSEAVARFRREIEAAGRLNHPNIVRTTDAGEVDGRHFLVMEWSDGRDLSKYVENHGPLPVETACEFIRQAALGLEYAHNNGLVHRDVKPSNLMVTTGEDGKPTVEVLDLGLALLHDSVNADHALTEEGQIMGTYDYIAPEQAMESHTVDARADIYSLGCTFYFLLTGQPPHLGNSGAKKLLAHQMHEPPPITQYRTDVGGNVILLVKKMMAKDPANRIGSMGEVASCLISAGSKGGKREGVWRALADRRRALVAASLLLAVLLFTALGTYAIIRISTPEGDYVIETDDPDLSFRVSKGAVILEDAKLNRKYNLKVITQSNGEFELEITDAGNELQFHAKTFRIKRGRRVALKAWFERRQAADMKPPVIPSRPKAKSPLDRLDPKDIRAADRADWQPKELVAVLSIYDSKSKQSHAAFSPDGNYLATGGLGPDAAVWLWDLRTRRVIRSWKHRHPEVGSHGIVFALGGSIVVSGGFDDETRIWEVESGKPQKSLYKMFNAVLALATSPDGKRLLTARRHDSDGPCTLDLWDLESRTKVRQFKGHKWYVLSVAFAPDGKSILSGGMDGTIRLWDVETGKEIWQFEEIPNVKIAKPLDKSKGANVSSVAFSPNGKWVASAISLHAPQRKATKGKWGVVRLWDYQGNKLCQRRDLQTPDRETMLNTVAFSPDSRTLAGASTDGHLILWDTTTGKQIWCRQWPRGLIQAIFAPDGRHLAVTSVADHRVYILRLKMSGGRVPEQPKPKAAQVGEIRRYLGHAEYVECVAFSPDGKSFLSGGKGDLILWDVESTKEKLHFVDPAKPLNALGRNRITSIAFSRDGKRAVTAGEDQIVRIWNVATGKVVKYLDIPKGQKFNTRLHVAFSPDDYILVGPVSGSVRRYNAVTGAEGEFRFAGNIGFFSRDGSKVLTMDRRSLVLSEVATGKALIAERLIDTMSMALAPNAGLAITGGLEIKDKKCIVRLWSLEKKASNRVIAGHEGTIQSLAISLDGRYALSGGGDSKVRLLSLESGVELHTFQGHTAPIRALTFSPDGRTALSAGGSDRSIILWRLPPP